MDTLVSMLLGPAVFAIVQAIKRYTGLQGLPALWLTYAISLAAALLALALSGSLAAMPLEDPAAFAAQLLQNASVAFAVATAIYRYVREREVGG